MGAAVNNLRSFVSWHAERRAFGWRFVWKYIALPPLGATLAVLVYGIIQSGMSVFNGGASLNSSAITLFSAWATGTLAGYGSHKVFIWLDDKVNSLFKVETKKVIVPDVIGKSLAEAKQTLNDGQLRLGDVSQETSEPQMAGKVIRQTPSGGTEIACESKVDLVIGSGSDWDDQTDFAGTTEEQVAQNGHLVGSDVSAVGSDNGLEAPELEETSEVLETEQAPVEVA
jgi:PASTA domain